jgi:hypothetical protein
MPVGSMRYTYKARCDETRQIIPLILENDPLIYRLVLKCLSSWETKVLWMPTFWNNLWVTACSLNAVIVDLDWYFLLCRLPAHFRSFQRHYVHDSETWHTQVTETHSLSPVFVWRVAVLHSCPFTNDPMPLSSSGQGVRSLLNPSRPCSSRLRIEGLPRFLDARGLYF